MSQNYPEIMCKTHSEVIAGYYLVDQPWNKFCSTCALNMALCGKKIEKQLTSQQFQRKMFLTSISNEFKKIIQGQTQQEQTDISDFIQILQEKYTSEISQKLKFVDKYISTLMKARDELFELYESEISKKISIYFQKQSRSILNTIQLKKQVQYIQSNFTNLIQRKSQQYQTKVQELNRLLINSKKLLPQSDQFVRIEQEFKNVYIAFRKSFAMLEHSRLDFGEISQNTQKSLTSNQINFLEQSNPKNIQNDLSIISSSSKKMSAKTQLKLRSIHKKENQNKKMIEIKNSIFSKRNSKRSLQKDISNSLIMTKGRCY